MTWTWKGKPADLFMEAVDEGGQQVAYIEEAQGPVAWWVDGMAHEADVDCDARRDAFACCATCWTQAQELAEAALRERFGGAG